MGKNVVYRKKGKGKGARSKPRGGGKWTTQDGKRKITTDKQLKFMFAKKLPMTHQKKTKSGKKRYKRYNA